MLLSVRAMSRSSLVRVAQRDAAPTAHSSPSAPADRALQVQTWGGQHSMAWRSMAWHCMAWSSMAQYGSAWHGTAWHSSNVSRARAGMAPLSQHSPRCWDGFGLSLCFPTPVLTSSVRTVFSSHLLSPNFHLIRYYRLIKLARN